MKEIYKITWNIIQNQAVIWKIFKFKWFKREDFLPDDSFLYKFIKEVPEWIWWNFFSIWKKNKWIELEILFENYYYKVRKWLKNYYQISEDQLKDFDIYYQKWKENIKGIIDDSLSEENYFALFLPPLVGYENNTKALARFQDKRIEFMWTLNNFNFRYFFWDDIEEVRNIPVFPLESWSRQIFKAKDFDFNKETNNLFETFLKDLYNETVNIIIREKAKQINKNSKDIEKEIYSFFKSLIPDIYQLWEEVFYDWLQYRAFADVYFYPISWYYLKIFDVIFLTKFIWNELITKADIDILKDILRNAVKNDLIDYFVIKTSIIKDKIKLPLEFDFERWVYIYKKANKDFIINVENKIEKNMIERIWEHFNTRWRYWLTVWIYSKEKDNLYLILKEIIQKYKKENIKIYLDTFEKENLFSYNNYLSVWLAENLQISNFNWLYTYLFNDRVFPIKPYIYWWLDIKTNTPIFLNPFKDFIRWNRHILLVGDTGAWKSILSQQMITTILKERVIAIDPAWTFSNITNIWFPIKKIDILKDMDNPIYIDINWEIFTRLWKHLDYESFFKQKADMILKILQVDFLEDEKQLQKYITNLIISIYKEYKGAITISLLFKEFMDIFKKLKSKKTKDIKYWKEIFETVSIERWLDKIWEFLSAINNLEGTDIYKILDKKKDLLDQIQKNLKIIFKIDRLNLSKIKAEANLAEEYWRPIQWDAMLKILHFEMLLDWISQYFLLNKEYMDNVLNLDYDNKMKSYLFIDEVHNMLEIKYFRIILNNFIREIRNRYAAAFLLSQNITDFPDEMLKNIQIKMFLAVSDVNVYLQKISWIWWEDETEEIKQLKILKLYFKEYEKIVDKHTWIESLGFYHYWKQVFLTKNVLSKYILDNIEILKT
jgi:hypothetical protein